jgi:hypothetical protein
MRHGILLLLCLGLVAADADDEPADEIPLVGRPADLPFSEASGRFRATTRAVPTTLEAQTPLTLTLQVRATGPVRRPPQRLDLRQVPAVTRDFHIQDLPDLPQPDANTWEFAWRLKPKRADVTEVPGLPFVWFDPDIRPASKGFQVQYTDPIPLQVREHGSVPVPLRAPARALEVITGPAVLARQSEPAVPGVTTIALLAVAPPLACIFWYLLWSRWHPEAAHRLRQRRSRAARLALRRLEATPPPAAVAAVVTGYLRERLDLGVREPTPAEARAHLSAQGFPEGLNDQAGHFYRACDAARFLPAAGSGARLTDEAVHLILAVEEVCSPPS